ncbi:hypothetical protein GCM10027570_50380 [Streptomonospora sediminis]
MGRRLVRRVLALAAGHAAHRRLAAGVRLLRVPGLLHAGHRRLLAAGGGTGTRRLLVRVRLLRSRTRRRRQAERLLPLRGPRTACGLLRCVRRALRRGAWRPEGRLARLCLLPRVLVSWLPRLSGRAAGLSRLRLVRSGAGLLVRRPVRCGARLLGLGTLRRLRRPSGLLLPPVLGLLGTLGPRTRCQRGLLAAAGLLRAGLRAVLRCLGSAHGVLLAGCARAGRGLWRAAGGWLRLRLPAARRQLPRCHRGLLAPAGLLRARRMRVLPRALPLPPVGLLAAGSGMVRERLLRSRSRGPARRARLDRLAGLLARLAGLGRLLCGGRRVRKRTCGTIGRRPVVRGRPARVRSGRRCERLGLRLGLRRAGRGSGGVAVLGPRRGMGRMVRSARQLRTVPGHRPAAEEVAAVRGRGRMLLRLTERRGRRLRGVRVRGGVPRLGSAVRAVAAVGRLIRMRCDGGTPKTCPGDADGVGAKWRAFAVGAGGAGDGGRALLAAGGPLAAAPGGAGRRSYRRFRWLPRWGGGARALRARPVLSTVRA